MVPGRRRSGGCWTCRLRRKRCDSVRPVCGSCQSLEITCHVGEAKPSWMDGNAGQKGMSEMIKKEIKHNAVLRKEKRLSTREDQNVFAIARVADIPSHTHDVSASTSLSEGRTSDRVSKDVHFVNSVASALSTSSVGPNSLWSPVDRPHELDTSSSVTSPIFAPVSLPTGPLPGSSWPTSPAGPISVLFGSVMIYMDYVFPFLFPFYQPSLTQTGRQWLLGLLCQNDASFHIAASLSAYFFLLVPQEDDQEMHEDCKALVRNRLVEQMDMALRSMQSTLSAFNDPGSHSSLLDRIRTIEEITQLLIVEITIHESVDWTVHLNPALMLFNEIFESQGIDHSGPKLSLLLAALPSPLPPGVPHHKPLPNTADQSALIFFVSLLLFIDVIASTSLGSSPSLQSYHRSLLSTRGAEKCCIELEKVVGCQNWVIVAIGNISALHAWKREAKKNGTFSVFNLIDLAAPISRALEDGIMNLDIDATRPQSGRASISRLKAYYSQHDRTIDSKSIATITRIWAYAAKIYLSVTLSGWQKNSADIHDSVADVLGLLQTIESPAQLRSLSWPIAVAGSLASASQERGFRSIVDSLGPLGEFGTALSALRVMETVWRSRETLDGDSWDFFSCLNIWDRPTLLL